MLRIARILFDMVNVVGNAESREARIIACCDA
jgi:hypothetical protein